MPVLKFKEIDGMWFGKESECFVCCRNCIKYSSNECKCPKDVGYDCEDCEFNDDI